MTGEHVPWDVRLGRYAVEVTTTAAAVFIAARAVPLADMPVPGIGAGLALGVVLLAGRRLALGVGLGVLLLGAGAGLSLPVALGVAVGAALAPLLTSLILYGATDFDPRLPRIRDLLLLLVVAALTEIGSIAGMVVGGTGVEAAPAPGWLTWWLANVSGITIATPLVLALAHRPLGTRTPRLLEAGALTLLTIGTTAVLVSSSATGRLALLLPSLFWASTRFGTAGASGVTLFAAVTWAWEGRLRAGVGALPPAIPNELDAVGLAFLALTGFALAVVLEQRTRTVAILKRQDELLPALHAFRDMTEGARDFIWECDLAGHITYVNEAVARALEKPALALLGQPGWKLLTNDPANAALLEVIERVARGEEVPPLRVQSRTSRGTRWVEALVSGVRDRDGRLVGIHGASRDVTTQVELEQALRRSEERYRAIIETQRDLILRTDPDARVTFANPAFRTLLGKGGAEIDGADFFSLLHPDDVSMVREALGSVAAPPHHTMFEARFRGADGWHEIECEAYATGVDAGTIVEIQAVGRDVSQQRQLEVAARRAQQLAALGTLAASVAHEINNPAAAILMNARLALAIHGSTNGGDDLAIALERIADEAKRCGRVARSVLQMAAEEPTEKWNADLNGLVRSAADHARAYVSSHGARMVLSLASGVLSVTVNPTQIELLLINLIHNAVENGGSGTAVWIRTAPGPGDAARLVVEDDGPGIPAAERARVFEPFFSHRAGGGGTGLGLSICQGIVTEHGGRIECAPGTKSGTAMIVELPGTAQSTDQRA